MLIRTFIELLKLRGTSVYVLPDNGLKIEIFTRLSYPVRSFINSISNYIQKFLEKTLF